MSTRAITTIAKNFTYQSYFDDALLQYAILSQDPGSSIVSSTLENAQTPGVGVALHPSSECPVAIRLKGGDADGDGSIVLTPGQVVRVGSFAEFEWGLPFGWLGGGLARLDVLHEDNVSVDYGAAAPDLIFHRTRIKVAAIGALLDVPNLPLSFPWGNAQSDTLPMAGSGLIAVQPTKTLMRLRVNSNPAAAIDLTLIVQGSNDLDMTSAGAIGTTDMTTADITFPVTQVLANLYPVAWIDDPLTRLGGDDAILNIVDPGATLVDEFVDVVRYGKIR